MTIPRVRTILLAVTGALALLALFLCVLILFLPRIVSSGSIQGKIAAILSRSTGRQITWSRLSFGWGEGLLLEGLAVGGGAPPLRRMEVRRMTLVPRIGRSDGRFYLRVGIQVAGPVIHLVPSPPKPPEPFREPLSALAEGLQRLAGSSIPLPVDPGLVCLVEGGTVTRSDPRTGRGITLSGLSFSLAAPDLRSAPVDLHFLSRVTPSSGQSQTARLDLRIDGLSDGSPRIRPAAGVIDAVGRAPGVTLRLMGGVERPEGVRARIDLDLPHIASMVPSLNPAPAGSISCRLQGAADRQQNLSGRIDLSTTPIRIPLTSRRGVVSLPEITLSQPFQTDLRRERVLLTGGEMAVGDLLSLAWGVTVDRPARPTRLIHGEIQRGRVDLGRVYSMASPFIPATPPLRLSGLISLAGLAFRSEPGRGTARITISRLGTEMESLSGAISSRRVDMTNLSLFLEETTVSVGRTGRVDTSGRISGSVTTLRTGAPSPLTLEKGRIGVGFSGGLGVGSSRGTPLRFSLRQELSLDSLRLGDTLHISGLSQRGAGGLTLTPERTLTISDLTLGGSVTTVDLIRGKGKISLPLTLQFTAPSLTREPGKGIPLLPSLSGKIATTGLRVALEGGVTGEDRLLSATTLVEGDLAKLSPIVSPFLPTAMGLGGNATISLTLDTPLSTPLPGKTLRQRLENSLGMIRKGGGSVSLSSVSLSLPGKGGETRARRIDTRSPLTLTVEGSRHLSLDGKVAVRGITTGGNREESDLDLRLSLTLADLDRLAGSLDLTLPTQGVTGNLTLSAGRIGKLLETEGVTPPKILRILDLSSTLSLKGENLSAAPPLPGGTRISGRGAVSAAVELTGGKSLLLSLTATPRELGISRKGAFAVEGVNGDIHLSRRYLLTTGGDPAGWNPLSTRLVAPPSQPQGLSQGIEGRLAGELRGGVAGERRITVRRIVREGGALPLVIGPLEADITLEPTRLGLSYLSTEILGGTLRSTLLLDLRPDLPLFSSSIACSGIETALLTSSGRGGFESALVGDASLSIPLRTTPREFLEGIRGSVTVRSIGRDALERILFFLDPQEKNEKLVAQRKLLRHGALTFLRSDVADGSLSLSGTGRVAGAEIALPAVERVKLAELPLSGKMAPLMEGIGRLTPLLDLLRADSIDIGGERPVPRRRSHVKTIQ